MEFNDYAEWVRKTPWPGKTPLPEKLYEEAKEVLDAAHDVDRAMRRMNEDLFEETQEDLRLELGDNLCLILLVADYYGIDIQSVIDANQEKLQNRNTYGKGNYGKRS